MIKVSPGCRHIFTIVIISLLLSGTGCFSFKSITSNKRERINALEEKVDLLSGDVESINTTNNELKERFNELTLEKERLNEEYTLLIDKQAAIESLQDSQKAEHELFKEGLSETKNLVLEIKQKLTLLESDKIEIKAQLEELANLFSRSIKAEQSTIGPKDVTEKPKVAKKDAEKDKDKTRKAAVKETQEKLQSNLVEELLNKAISLYRQGNYEDAITKWEEAIALDPNKLEALFNIEIAQDRIKENQKNLGK